MLLDAAEAHRPEERQSLLFANPVEVLAATTPQQVRGVLARIDEAVTRGYYVAGCMSYEAAPAWEPSLPSHPSDAPLCWFGIYEQPMPLSDDCLRATLHPQRRVHLEAAPTFGLDRRDYDAPIQAIKSLIHEGDVYQINFTDALTLAFSGEALDVYAALRQQQGVPFGAWLNVGSQQILSFSPELFFARAGRRLWTRPMKGTIHRGATPSADADLADQLRSDAKSQAENLMIVDLLRNDLSVVCAPGSVRVPALFEVEAYRTLHQMTSTVEGQLVDEATYADIFAALFPCGSVTGAPKLRAMQHIHALERQARGVYCGTIGYIAPDDRAVFNVAIRTLTVQDQQARMGVGSGIVWDSDSRAEYDECLLKAAFVSRALAPQLPPGTGLIETMRVADGHIALLDLHLERLNRSALALGFAFDRAAATDGIAQQLGARGDAVYVLRLVLHRDGHLTFSTREAASFDGPLQVLLVEADLDPNDLRLLYKTTARDAYSAAYERAREAGCDEALLVNRAGYVTEGSRSNLFVRFGEVWHTPPTSLGLLGGVFRQHWLDADPNVVEQAIHRHDLPRADDIVLTNAVWGRVPCVVTAGVAALEVMEHAYRAC